MGLTWVMSITGTKLVSKSRYSSEEDGFHMTTYSKPMEPKERFEKALGDPSSVFDSPLDVLIDERLSTAQKKSVLAQWELDARELAVAEEENMSGGEPSCLAKVLAAQRRLADETAASPTKLGG